MIKRHVFTEMKSSAILCLLIIFACGCNRNNLQTKLLHEQKLLKDSVNNIYDRIDVFVRNGHIELAKLNRFLKPLRRPIRIYCLQRVNIL